MKKKNLDNFYIFFLLSILALLIFYSSQLMIIRNLKDFFERPILLLERSLLQFKQKLGMPFDYLVSCQQTFKEKTLLEQEINNLLVKTGQFSVCLEENEAMRRLLGAPLPSSWHFIPAKLISFWQRLKINVGQKAGVEEGMVVVSQNILIGKIDSVQKYSSTVILVTDPSLKIPVIVRAPSKSGIKARGILTGYFENKMVLDQALKSEEIYKEDLVFTSGEAGWLPDLLIGKIEEIEEGKEKVFKKAFVSCLADFEDLRYLFVVKPT